MKDNEEMSAEAEITNALAILENAFDNYVVCIARHAKKPSKIMAAVSKTENGIMRRFFAAMEDIVEDADDAHSC